MSRKYAKPFSSYELGRFRPMALEQDAEGLFKYKTLADNPIYYQNAIQYCGGELYRTILGYELIWDQNAERTLMLCLDFFCADLENRGLYWLEEIKVIKTQKIHGVSWPRGIAPQELRFDLMWAYGLKEGESLTARVNLVDKPNHVDLERASGEVFTIPYIRYENYITNNLFKRKKVYEDKILSRATKRTSSPKTKGLKLVKRASREDPSQSPPSQLLNLSQRQRR